MKHTREEKLFVSMQQRFQQAAINDRERRTLLEEFESQKETKRIVVKPNYANTRCLEW